MNYAPWLYFSVWMLSHIRASSWKAISDVASYFRHWPISGYSLGICRKWATIRPPLAVRCRYKLQWANSGLHAGLLTDSLNQSSGLKVKWITVTRCKKYSRKYYRDSTAVKGYLLYYSFWVQNQILSKIIEWSLSHGLQCIIYCKQNKPIILHNILNVEEICMRLNPAFKHIP